MTTEECDLSHRQNADTFSWTFPLCKLTTVNYPATAPLFMQQQSARTEHLHSSTNIYHNIGTMILKNAIANAATIPQSSIDKTSDYSPHSALTSVDSVQTGLASTVRSWSPATCGEFVQGAIDGRDFLVNAPIDLYSCATVKTASVPGIHLQNAKGFEKVQSVLNLLDVTHRSTVGHTVSLHSQVPRGKGMASSSADLAAALSAVAQAQGQQFCPQPLPGNCQACIDQHR